MANICFDTTIIVVVVVADIAPLVKLMFAELGATVWRGLGVSCQLLNKFNKHKHKNEKFSLLLSV